METLKQEAINVISKMPDSADIDDSTGSMS